MAEHEQPKSSLHYMANIECRLDSIETPVHALVALYRPLISRCVKVDDIVFYLDDIIFTGTVTRYFLLDVRLRINWELFKKVLHVTKIWFLNYLRISGRNWERTRLIISIKKFEMVLILYWIEEREEIIALKARKGSTKAMKHLLSLIEKSVANDKWTKFVEILEKKGTYCIQ